MTYSPLETPRPLAGRGPESARLGRLLADARTGQSAVLVLRGEPGIGKTALLGYVAERAAGFKVVRATGAESELELPFASLHQLCGPMLGGLGRLPPPQRDALGTAFGLSSGAQPDRFLIGLAVLSLLADAAEERPLLCLVDDAQWLDRSSAQVLAFVARRLQAESVVLAHDSPATTVAPITLTELDARRDDLKEEYYEFVAPTEYVPHHLPEISELVHAAEKAGDGGVTGFVEAASTLIHEKFSYVKGATHVHSSIEDALKAGAGVCQDFAHLLLSVVRTRGFPGRYVSGYIVPKSTGDPEANLEEVIGGQASHAWVEVWLPGTGWYPLDPTLGAPVGLRHIRVGYGRDYGDVAPVRGVYKGHAGQRLSVDVRVRPALDSDGREQLQKTASVPTELPVEERSQQPEQQQQ